jgi:CheY-like chemotaxis protein
MARNPIKILIVDDDQDVLIELEHLLEDEGYSTATAWSGEEALALSEKSQFDLLLLDEDLADVDAHALFDELVSQQPNAFRFLMHTRKENSSAAVCKWEHADVKAKIRNCLAA